MFEAFYGTCLTAHSYKADLHTGEITFATVVAVQPCLQLPPLRYHPHRHDLPSQIPTVRVDRLQDTHHPGDAAGCNARPGRPQLRPHPVVPGGPCSPLRGGRLSRQV